MLPRLLPDPSGDLRKPLEKSRLSSHAASLRRVYIRPTVARAPPRWGTRAALAEGIPAPGAAGRRVAESGVSRGAVRQPLAGRGGRAGESARAGLRGPDRHR